MATTRKKTGRFHRFNKEIDRAAGFATRSILAVPLITGQEAIGVLEIINKLDGSEFSEQDLKATVSIASPKAGLPGTSF
ncbi:GAF domain-containing protein [Chloroflexota bacterium]